jgi:hypothetical protein
VSDANQMMDKIIMRSNTNRGLFLATREDYIEKIVRLARIIEEQYPELSDSIHNELIDLYKAGSLNDLVDYYDKLYQKVKEYNIPSYRPYWMFKTKFYS